MCDKYFYRIYKLLLINYHTDAKFKSDIEDAATVQLKRHMSNIDDRELILNTLYILEEIALNLRVKLWNQLNFEYYIGNYHLPLIRLYSGEYNLSISDICNKSDNIDFRFFEGFIDKENQVEWKENTPGNTRYS